MSALSIIPLAFTTTTIIFRIVILAAIFWQLLHVCALGGGGDADSISDKVFSTKVLTGDSGSIGRRVACWG